MNRNDLLNIAGSSKQLKAYCMSLCNGRDIGNDLFQEFLLVLCEVDENILFKKLEQINFIGYCYGIIKNINLNRIRGYRVKGQENPLVERQTPVLVDFEIMEIEDECYTDTVDVMFEKTIDTMEKTKAINRKDAEILFLSLDKTANEIAKDFNVSRRHIEYKNQKTKKIIKSKLKWM